MTSDLPNHPQSRFEQLFDGLFARALGRVAILAVLGIGGYFGKQLLDDVRAQNVALAQTNTGIAVLNETIKQTRLARDFEVKQISGQLVDHEGRLRLVEHLTRR
jgi:hypothetical protein